ncbi:fibronectin type III domain-containing protein [Pirellulaceae bacterium SH449]
MRKHIPIFSRIFALGVVSTALSVPVSFAQDDAKGEAKKSKELAADPAEVHKPSLIPDRVVLTLQSDPRTTQAVTWRTSTAVKDAVGQILLEDHGPLKEKNAITVKAKMEYLKTNLSEAHYHSVEFTDLEPQTTYAYRVGDGVNWSEWFQFVTAPSKPEPFSFVYFGDAQNDVRSQWSRVIRRAYTDAPNAKLMIHAGDLINVAESDAEWGDWFKAGSFLHATMNCVPVPGNHEQAKVDDKTRRLSHHWRAQFTLPDAGLPGLEETCYTFEYADTRFIGLNSNEKLDEQAAWLNKVLAANKSKWVICTFHHPVYSTGKDRDNPELRTKWKPIFDAYRVDLVLTGHDHTYGRTGLETPVIGYEVNAATGSNVADSGTGTVYVVSVSGPKMYPLQPSEHMRRVAEDTQLYQVITIDGDTLKFEARTALGSLYDAFQLTKRPGQINELTEIDPEIETRTRPEPIKEAATVGSTK